MKTTARKTTLRNSVLSSGSFVSMSDMFPSADEAIRNAAKIEYTTDYSEEHRIQSYFSTDKMLLDIAAIDSAQIDFEKMAKDCDLLKDVIEKNAGEIQQCLIQLQEGQSENIDKVESLLEEIGLTEETFSRNGGGLLWLIVPVAIVALSGCTGANSNKVNKQSTTPKPKPTPDAGPQDGGRPR